MATQFDTSPLYRSSIGFDRILNLLENSTRLQAVKNWPPYDIVKSSDDSYRIVMAVPGFSQDELELTYQPNLLIVAGRRDEADEQSFLHRGIDGRNFEHRFELADHVRVEGARLENGLLSIELFRELPEAMKPRRIEIQRLDSLPPSGEPARITDQKAA